MHCSCRADASPPRLITHHSLHTTLCGHTIFFLLLNIKRTLDVTRALLKIFEELPVRQLCSRILAHSCPLPSCMLVLRFSPYQSGSGRIVLFVFS